MREPVIIGNAMLHLGDCIEVMRTMADSSVDSIVTDPPYELTSARPTGRSEATRGAVMGGFMGMKWDASGIAHSVEMWAEALRVLKPGGHLLAFSGTRTQHRMVCAIEDAGFEIRDQVGWAFGSGFPKSRNIAEHDMEGEDAARWAGWGTALKPAWEPICVARKPLVGTVAANLLAHGTGALNIDACRVSTSGEVNPSIERRKGAINHLSDRPAAETEAEGRMASRQSPEAYRAERAGEADGRWPANIIHDGSAEVVALFPESTSGSRAAGVRTGMGFHGAEGDGGPAIAGSSGSAARFFYCAKASRGDRNEGCEALPQKIGGMVSNTSGQHLTRRDDDYEAKPLGNHHPTVKPTDLMAYLCRLVTPPGGIVLDPFMGSGSTGKAAMREGFRFVGIDMTPEYVEIAHARITHEIASVANAAAEAKAAAEIAARQPDLFATTEDCNA